MAGSVRNASVWHARGMLSAMLPLAYTNPY